MHIWDKRPSGARWPGAGGAAGAMVLSLLAAGVLLNGCASPGPPLPPTLNLPEVVSGTGLTAVRVGDAVRLDWTTPTQTTDKLTIKGPVTAVICRDTVGANVARIPAKTSCAAVARVAVTPGASEAMDTLPAELTAGPARLLAYRVELLNVAGRTAGPSAAAMAVAGVAPAAIDGFAGRVDRAGVVLEWKRQEQGTGEDWVELERTTLNAPPAAEKKAGLPGAPKETKVTRFRAAGSGDAGGAIDRTAEIGSDYSYTAQRVQVETVGGQKLESRGAVSAAISFQVRDVFPPAVPQGLVAVPGFAGTAAGGQAGKPAIDLSWEPDVEPRVAGYRVYRREALEDNSGRWVSITPELVTGAAYRDATVLAGRQYEYRVTAVSTAGSESGPSETAVETAPG
jgi:hypothetical protein